MSFEVGFGHVYLYDVGIMAMQGPKGMGRLYVRTCVAIVDLSVMFQWFRK